VHLNLSYSSLLVLTRIADLDVFLFKFQLVNYVFLGSGAIRDGEPKINLSLNKKMSYNKMNDKKIAGEITK